MERHVDEVMAEHPVEEEKASKKDGGGGRGGGSGKVSRTDPDARLSRTGGGFEPSYKQHDDARGVVHVSVITVEESQVEAVRELSGRDPALTADSGYAYSKVYGALERRGVAALIPAKKEPSQSRVPLRLFRYDARHDIVKCPRGKTLTPRREAERGRYYRSRTRDCAGCALREDCLPKALSRARWCWSRTLVPGAVARAPAPCVGRGGAADVVALGGLPRRGEDLARTCARGASGAGEHFLPDGGGDQPQAVSAALAAILALWRATAREEPLRVHKLRGLPVRRRVNLHTARSRNRVIQQPRRGRNCEPMFSSPPAIPPFSCATA